MKKKYFIFVFLIQVTILFHFVLFVFQRYLLFRCKKYYPMPVYDKCGDIDLFYVDQNSDTDIVYCHGSRISAKVHNLLLNEMAMKTGMNVISFYLRGIYNNRGVTSEKGVTKEIKQIAKYLKNRQKKYIVFGQSLGCNIAIKMSRNLECDLTILENPFISYQAAVADKICYKLFSWLVIDNWNNEENIKGLKSVLFLVSTRDTLVPNTHSEYLSKLIPNSSVKYLQESTHFNSAKNPKYYEYIMNFIQNI